jgi:hypothetical protein
MDADFAGLCENVNNFSKDGIFASDRIERRKIVLDDFDRDTFLKHLGNVLSETATPCFAWALIPNHAHLFLRVSRNHRHCHGQALALDRLCGKRQSPASSPWSVISEPL